MQGPVEIGSRLELFVDDLLVESMERVSMRLHRAFPQPLAESPLAISYTTVIRDGDLYRAYYRDCVPGYDGHMQDGNPGEITCYAESRDGHEWAYPDLGVHEVRSQRGGNVILADAAPYSHNFSPFLDSRPGVPEDERFKALAGISAFGPEQKPTPGSGLHTFASPDGIHWRMTSDAAVIAYNPELHGKIAFDSQNVAFWSEAEGRYVAYFRHMKTPGGALRTVSRATSEDFREWRDESATFTPPNLASEHLYTSQTHPYFRAPHIYVALPSRFAHGQIMGRPVPGERWGAANVGSTDIMFMSTRAGSDSFQRTFEEAFMRPGLDPKNWENRANYVALNVVPTGPAEMSIYHLSGHRYTLRTDGFASANAGAQAGELVTRPLVFEGDTLCVNYSTSIAGSLQVEIRDHNGTPVPGFSLDDSPPMVGDAIEEDVKWKGDSDLRALAGRPVQLRFVMRDCDLYAFRFGTTRGKR